MLFATIALTLVSIVLGLCLGSTQVTPADFMRAFLSGDITDPAYRIVIHSRLPRVLGALLAGSALAVSGAILQAVLQNSPLVVIFSPVSGMTEKYGKQLNAK